MWNSPLGRVETSYLLDMAGRCRYYCTVVDCEDDGFVTSIQRLHRSCLPAPVWVGLPDDEWGQGEARWRDNHAGGFLPHSLSKIASHTCWIDLDPMAEWRFLCEESWT